MPRVQEAGSARTSPHICGSNALTRHVCSPSSDLPAIFLQKTPVRHARSRARGGIFGVPAGPAGARRAPRGGPGGPGGPKNPKKPKKWPKNAIFRNPASPGGAVSEGRPRFFISPKCTIEQRRAGGGLIIFARGADSVLRFAKIYPQ